MIEVIKEFFMVEVYFKMDGWSMFLVLVLKIDK